MATPEQETDALAYLEERVQRAVALVNRLRLEKEAALTDLAAVRALLGDSEKTNTQLSEELDALRAERLQVRSRLQKLIGHIDQLGAA
jgi:FtsZ-binding cell division protein ZapB